MIRRTVTIDFVINKTTKRLFKNAKTYDIIVLLVLFLQYICRRQSCYRGNPWSIPGQPPHYRDKKNTNKTSKFITL